MGVVSCVLCILAVLAGILAFLFLGIDELRKESVICFGVCIFCFIAQLFTAPRSPKEPERVIPECECCCQCKHKMDTVIVVRTKCDTVYIYKQL